MARVWNLILLLTLPCAAWAADPEVPADLVGNWKVESIAFKGGVPSKPSNDIWLVILENGDFVMKASKDLYGGTVAVDPTAKPPAIDFRVTLRSDGGKPYTGLGIYELKDGILITAHAIVGQDRPQSLEPQVNSVIRVSRRSMR